MGYSDGEALVLTRVQACTNFDSTNTSRCNWKILNTGNSDHYAILKPGPFEDGWDSITGALTKWTTIIELWQLYTDETTSYTNLYGYLGNLFAIRGYPHLGNSAIVRDSNFRGAPAPDEMWPKSGGPIWLRWNINIEWTEETNVTFSE